MDWRLVSQGDEFAASFLARIRRFGLANTLNGRFLFDLMGVV